MRNALRSFRALTENRSKSIRKRFRLRLATRIALRASWGLSRRLLEHLWDASATLLDASWLAQGAPRSALGWHLGDQKLPRTRPDTSPKWPWASKTAQNRFFVDLGLILDGFSNDLSSLLDRFRIDFPEFSNAFSSIFARAACDKGTKVESQKGIA